MSRARGTPLSVKNFSSSIDPRLYFETATSVHLDFTILCPARRILIDDALKRDAPKQEVLTMIEAQTRVPKLLLTGQLLGGNCCLLRELTVVGFVLRSVLNFSGLKQLTLRSCMDGDPQWEAGDGKPMRTCSDRSEMPILDTFDGMRCPIKWPRQNSKSANSRPFPSLLFPISHFLSPISHFLPIHVLLGLMQSKSNESYYNACTVTADLVTP
jgi:hypothetical protein